MYVHVVMHTGALVPGTWYQVAILNKLLLLQYIPYDIYDVEKRNHQEPGSAATYIYIYVVRCYSWCEDFCDRGWTTRKQTKYQAPVRCFQVLRYCTSTT